MSKKLIVFFAVVVVVIAGLFVANNVIGARVASSVDEQLQVIFTENAATAPFQFEYDEVTASPLGRSVTISGFKVRGEDLFPVDMEAQSVKLKMPLSEILALANNKELKSINKMSIDLQQPVFKSEETAAKFSAKSMKMTYTGEASLFEMERMDEGFLPSTKQSIDVHFQDMGWEGIEDLLAMLPNQVQSTLGDSYSQKGSFRLSAEFDPYKKQINFKRWEIDSKTTTVKAQALFNFTGDSFEDFEPKDGYVEMDYALGKLKESFPELGEYSIKKVKAELELDLDFEKARDNPESANIFAMTPIQNLSYSMRVDGLKLEPSESMTDQISQFDASFDLSVFSVNKMNIDFEMKNGEMSLNDLTIKIDDLIDLQGSAKMGYEVLPNQGYFGEEAEVAVFENAHIEIESKSLWIDELIKGMEAPMPKPFPRKNGKLIIDISGPISNPTFKGVND